MTNSYNSYVFIGSYSLIGPIQYLLNLLDCARMINSYNAYVLIGSYSLTRSNTVFAEFVGPCQDDQLL